MLRHRGGGGGEIVLGLVIAMIAAPALAEGITAEAIYDARFCRMWRYYLVAAELTFRLDRQVVFQFQLTKRQEAVPLTRDYLY